MTRDLRALNAAVDLKGLVLETHPIDRSGNVICPFHDDQKPSCHIYPDHFHCFPCGAHGDALDWFKQVHGLNTADAIAELRRRTGGYIHTAAPRRTDFDRPPPALKPIGAHTLSEHRRRAGRLDHIPKAMEERGFSLSDLKQLGFATYGDDAVFPVTGPDGTVFALKKRHAAPQDGQRYRYVTKGHGTPAWCSPGFMEPDQVLVIEGELNGMACWLAAPELAVMGVAGTNGRLHQGVLKGRTVYVYADGDEAGRAARRDWADEVRGSGAADVYLVEPWNYDACDITKLYGRAELRRWLV